MSQALASERMAGNDLTGLSIPGAWGIRAASTGNGGAWATERGLKTSLDARIFLLENSDILKYVP